MSKFIVEREGDIFTSECEIIGHGVNIRGLMGAGIAAQVRARYPEAYSAYRAECIMGELQPGGMLLTGIDNTTNRAIAHLATQREPGPDARYSWLTRSVSSLMDDCSWGNGVRVALPQIGCGIGGLEWPIVKEIIVGIADYYEVHTELWTYKKESDGQND